MDDDSAIKAGPWSALGLLMRARAHEMHVDGGTMSQVFLWGGGVSLDRLTRNLPPELTAERRPIRVFVIRNGRFNAEYEYTRPLVLSIAGRAVSTMIKAQGIGDTIRLYALCQRDGLDFNVAVIPTQFSMPLKEPFDEAYMKGLYELAFDMARKGYPWQKAPPYVSVSKAE